MTSSGKRTGPGRSAKDHETPSTENASIASRRKSSKHCKNIVPPTGTGRWTAGKRTELVSGASRRSSGRRLLHGEREMAFRVEDKAEAYADNFERQCTLNLKNLDDMNLVDNVDQRRLAAPSESICAACPAEVKKLIKSTNARKAPGSDNMGNRVLQHLPVRAVSFLTIIVNAMLTFRRFTSQWKCVDVIMLLKSHQPSKFPQSYMPTSVYSPP